MIEDAEAKGTLKPGGTIIEPTSGNTGLGLAMVAAIKGYRAVFTMPDKMSREKIDLLKAFGARVVVTPTAVPPDHPDSYYRVAERIHRETPNSILPNQYANQANPRAHYESTGPEIWRDTDGRITHFVSAMGTTGTIMGVSRYLKEQNPAIRIIGAQPEEGSQIPGIRKWPEAYLPKIYDKSRVDQLEYVSQAAAEQMARRLAAEEGIFCGISAAGACEVALRLSRTVENATIVFIVC